ncbi:MAG: restriction endonuclease subunit R, partial [Thermoplasmata archaeon]|nr:restriction endonuclease subunit R [Thermoplasmata archaeon]
IQRYFDAIMIGLTATPREHEARSTFEMFDCEFRKPTVEYSYDEAVRDGVLVRYRADIIGTEVLADGISGSKLPGYLKDQLRRQEVDPEITEFTGSDFDRIFMDDTTNAIVIVEFMNLCYKSDEGKPCKTIFFCASQAHARHIKRIFGKLYPNLGSDVQVITSNEYRAGDEIKRFKKQSEPRIALSVGMLDTGVDIPEVCNLVFVKPVFSHIRFWQMVGRGTRNLESCRHREWLPEGKKNDFYILDFKIGGISNIKLHEFTESREREPSKGVTTRIFENRVKLMERPLDEAQRRVIYDKIMASIDAFDEENFMVREKLPTISRIKENAFNLRNYVKELMHDILPLVLISTGGNPYVSSFILKTESLFRFILDKRFDKIEDIRQYVEEMALNILSKDNLYEINQSKEKIIKIFQDNFWDDLTFEDVEFMIREIAPLMKYYEPVPRKVVQVDKPDVILDRETFEKEVKQDERLREFIETNPIMRKLKNGEGLTPPELKDLERQLIDLNPHYGIESVQR